VSGAFHSPLVEPAQRELIEFLERFTFKDPSVDVVCNVDARIIRSAEAIIDALSRQLTNPVLWSDSMRALVDSWDGRIMEAGPGRILAGLMKRIERRSMVSTCGTAEELAQVIAAEVEIA
jgi:[acyl-carrier-protein] S-malonyltransferase